MGGGHPPRGRSGSVGVGRVGQVAREAPNPLAVIRIEIMERRSRYYSEIAQ